MPTNEDLLKKVLSDALNVPAGKIGETTSVDTVESWNSLTHLNMVLGLEEQFRVKIPEDRIMEIVSYPKIKEVLARQGISFA